MANRHTNRIKFNNNTDEYKKQIKKRGKPSIIQYTSPNMKSLTVAQILTLKVMDHTWKGSDSFTALSHKYYGDISLWWVIAHFNEVPSEFKLSQGDIIGIPFPVDRVLSYMDL